MCFPLSLVRLLSLIASASIMLAGPVVVASGSLQAYAMKIEYLLNFSKLTHWEKPNFSASPDLNVCITHQPFFEVALEKMHGMWIADKALMIKKVNLDSDIKKCHILYVNAESEPLWPTALKYSGSILTIGETDRFLQAGGIVKFYMRNQQVLFDIQGDHLKAAHLSIEGRLLRLATAVRNRQQ